MNLYRKYHTLREAFRSVFQREQKEPDRIRTVMEDLREFCRADSSCVIVAKDGRVDTHATAVAEGRREVYLRIMQTLSLTDVQLQKLEGLNDD